jgi:hypothetical protein
MDWKSFVSIRWENAVMILIFPGGPGLALLSMLPAFFKNMWYPKVSKTYLQFFCLSSLEANIFIRRERTGMSLSMVTRHMWLFFKSREQAQDDLNG